MAPHLWQHSLCKKMADRLLGMDLVAADAATQLAH